MTQHTSYSLVQKFLPLHSIECRMCSIKIIAVRFLIELVQILIFLVHKMVCKLCTLHTKCYLFL